MQLTACGEGMLGYFIFREHGWQALDAFIGHDVDWGSSFNFRDIAIHKKMALSLAEG